MTTVSEAAKNGHGKILANYREIPAPSRAIAQEVINSLKEAGIHGVYALGNASEPICQIAIGLNRVGMVLLGGLNPVAAAVEAGIEIDNIAESGMIEFNQLTSFWKLKP
jgi:repressor of nif and glnA expression